MFATDFEYDSKRLSDFGLMLCKFDGSSGFETVSAGSEITFNKVIKNQGRSYSLTSTKYDKCIQVTFQVCKSPCIDGNDKYISHSEYREIMRWLNRREFLKFRPIYEDSDREEIFFNASFNVSKIEQGGFLYGLELTMETDKPFGYGNLKTVSWDVEDTSTVLILTDTSDEIGSICPDVVITCNGAGDLHLNNLSENCETIVRNCSVGEVITINGDSMLVFSSLPSHNIIEDFNYEYFRIGNAYNDRENEITISLPCNITISYYPVIKDVP